jgi:hypothetical protein
LSLLDKVHNHCVKSLNKITEQDIGRTWKQSFDLSSFDDSLPKKLTLTLTAMQVNTKIFGQMIAVRALSEPFVVKVFRVTEGDVRIKDIKSRIRAAYLFDSEIENVYLSMSVFEATTNINGPNEKLRHEVATYRTNAEGVAVDLSGLSREFESFVRKVGLTNKSLEVVNEAPLPRWAQSDGLLAAQVSNICGATACEGALNPVATVCIPVARTLELQSLGKLASVRQKRNIGGILSESVPAMGGMKIAVAPAHAGGGLRTAALIGGATGGGLVIADSVSSGGGKANRRSPVAP